MDVVLVEDEIGADADVLNSDEIDHVIDVAHDRVDGGLIAAEEDTHVAFADQLGVLALGEQRELAAPIDRANVASRPPGTPMGGGRMTRTSSGGPSD